uniref:Transmembrane channel-like protein n=1 Tax=Pseudonaja textilis TaxID=8673 RepID=A0A670YYZ5_PSETE
MEDFRESNLRSQEEETGSGGGHQVSPSLFLQLPSNQTLRFRGRKAAAWEAAWEGASVPIEDPYGLVPEKLLEEEEDRWLLKEMPLCLEEKRKLRTLQKQAVKQLSGWQLWRVEKSKTLRRLQSQASIAISSAKLWRGTLHHIEGHFGTGIQSYFNFLRFLILLNFVASLLVNGLGWFILKKYNIKHASLLGKALCQKYNPIPQGLVSYFSYIMDLLSGKGFIEQTYLFYGYYSNTAVRFVSFAYDIPLAYLLTTFFYLLFCLAWIVRRSVLCLKQSLVSEDTSLASYSNKVFAGWDFSLMQDNMVQLKHKSIRYELRMDLEEASFRKHQAELTTSQRVGLYVLRSLINILVLVFLGVSFYCIYLAVSYSQEKIGKVSIQYLLELLLAYLPSAVITAANLLVPMIFQFLVPLEKYPLSFQIKITLLRYKKIWVFLRTIWYKKNLKKNYLSLQCWETSVGQEMYKLMIFDLVITLLVILLVEFPRKMLVTYWPSCLLLKWWGEQEFMVPDNILDLVYGQTLCWTGALFCPLLPVLNTIKYIAVFYMKKLSLYANCRPAERTFRASSSNSFFLLILLLGFTISCVPALYSIFVLPPSKACGPFRDQPTMWNVVSHAVSELPAGAQDFLRFVGSVAFSAPFVFMFYLKALANSYSSRIKSLKRQLCLVSSQLKAIQKWV